MKEILAGELRVKNSSIEFWHCLLYLCIAIIISIIITINAGLSKCDIIGYEVRGQHKCGLTTWG